jgi:hypothetical protein
MTLYKQLTLIIIVLFMAGFIGTVTISTGNLRHSLAGQLESHAQDTATSPGLSPLARHASGPGKPATDT